MHQCIIPSRLKKVLAGLTFLLICLWNVYPERNSEVPMWSTLKQKAQTLSKDDFHIIMNHFIKESGKDYGFLGENVDKLFTVFNQIDNDTMENKGDIVSFLSQPIINSHTFTYMHNPISACLDGKIEILFVVPSAPENFEKRNKLRIGDYGNFINNINNKAKLLFFIGKPNSTETQAKIDVEADTCKDIVQESFDDVYRNIRYKAVSMLKWASTFCQKVSFVIRNDDDISVNLSALVMAVKRTHSKYANFILGRVRLNDIPCRNASEKPYLSRREYPSPHLPPFALGGLLAYPILTVELLYQAALRLKPIWLDDVFITGMCAPKVGVKLLSDPAFLFKHNGKIAD